MNHVTMLAQSMDASRPGNFFFALPISGVRETPLGPKSVYCENRKGIVKGFRCYSPSSDYVASEPPMGANTWLTYGLIVMFDGPDMTTLSIKRFMEINPAFDVMAVLTRCTARSDLAAVLEVKLGVRDGQGMTEDPHVANQGMRDITSQSSVVSRTKH